MCDSELVDGFDVLATQIRSNAYVSSQLGRVTGQTTTHVAPPSLDGDRHTNP